MENVVLTVHLILAVALTLSVLLQRSEGGGVLSGSAAAAGRPATTAVAKVTWMLAAAFIASSIALTVIAARNAGRDSVIEGIAPSATGEAAPASGATGAVPPPAAAGGETTPGLTPEAIGEGLTPPSPTDAPVAPPAAD
jgi:preprotein translocase subunit SecG